MAFCSISGIGTGPSSTFPCSPNQTVPLPSNKITTTILPRSTALSLFCYDRNSIVSKTHFPFCPPLSSSKKSTTISSAISSEYVEENLPPALDSTSDPPPIFDGTTRLYISYTCPYAQRAWIARNCKGLQEKIELVPIDLKNRPAWYKEKVYPPNKVSDMSDTGTSRKDKKLGGTWMLKYLENVPALEHNNEVKGESLDLIKYIDTHFEGPSLFPDDPAKKEFADELFSSIGAFYKTVTSSFKGNGTEAGIAFDDIETALSKFEDGPFFLGQFSLVDIAHAPFIERFQPFLLDVKNYDITLGRPKLATWIEEMNKNEAYKQTKRDPKELVESYKKRFMAPI